MVSFAFSMVSDGCPMISYGGVPGAHASPDGAANEDRATTGHGRSFKRMIAG